jgi:hypothetical protein
MGEHERFCTARAARREGEPIALLVMGVGGAGFTVGHDVRWYHALHVSPRGSGAP